MAFTLKQEQEQSPNKKLSYKEKDGFARILGIFAHFVAVLCKSTM